MSTKRISIITMVAITTLFTASLALADLSGLQIIEKVYYRPTGNDAQSELMMTLINSRGDRRERVIKQYFKNYGKEEKTVMFFVAPADVRDTSFMNWSYEQEGKDDDQWIYLPALKRVKRISSDSKGDYFMGSDFTYDDLGDRYPSEDTHKLLKTESIEGETVYVVESVPEEEDYMYSKTITWIIKDKWTGLKKEFYDEDGELLKTLTIKKVDKISGYWMLTHTEMHNVQKDHTTKMELKNVQLDKGLSDNMFTERMMMRGVR